MKHIKIIMALVFTLFAGNLFAAEIDLVQQAEEAYTQSKFAEAAELYQQALDKNGVSADACYNLGNCYYRMNKIAPAILNYERALLLSPNNSDIRYNLEIARLKTVDKIEPVGKFFLSEWYDAVSDLLSVNQWSRFAIFYFILFILSLTAFFFSRQIGLKKVGFYGAIVFLTLCVLSNVFAFSQKKKLDIRKTAIIFSSTVTLKSSPDNSGNDAFILHEGTKVSIKQNLGEWNEVVTEGGDVGWLKSGEMEII